MKTRAIATALLLIAAVAATAARPPKFEPHCIRLQTGQTVWQTGPAANDYRGADCLPDIGLLLDEGDAAK